MTVTHLMAAVAFDTVLIPDPGFIIHNLNGLYRAAPDTFHTADAAIDMDDRPGWVLVDQFKDKP